MCRVEGLRDLDGGVPGGGLPPETVGGAGVVAARHRLGGPQARLAAVPSEPPTSWLRGLW